MSNYTKQEEREAKLSGFKDAEEMHDIEDMMIEANKPHPKKKITKKYTREQEQAIIACDWDY
jgi:hypothetical protein